MELAMKLKSIVQRFVPEHIYGAAWGIYRSGEMTLGSAGWTTQSGLDPITPDTWFDLASLTKVIGTLPAILVASQHRRLALNNPIGHWMPELSVSVQRQTIRALLSHTAGLPSGFEVIGPSYLPTPAAIWERVRTLTVTDSKHQAVYSDIGYFLLGLIVERVWGKPLVRVVQEDVLPAPPICLKERVDPLTASVAATRYCPTRQRIIQGEAQNRVVAVWGQALGHAGLFSTARSVLQYGIWWLSQLNQSPFEEAVQPVVAGRGLGWMLAGCPQLPNVPWPPDAFGHTGFTGTSLVAIPGRQLVAVLLTNRTHPNMDNPWIRPMREEFYAAVLADSVDF